MHGWRTSKYLNRSFCEWTYVFWPGIINFAQRRNKQEGAADGSNISNEIGFGSWLITVLLSRVLAHLSSFLKSTSSSSLSFSFIQSSFHSTMDILYIMAILLGSVSLSNISFLLAALVAFGLSHQVIYDQFFHPLASYPGPFFASVTRIWIAWHNDIEDETAVCWELIQKHGQNSLNIRPTKNT